MHRLLTSAAALLLAATCLVSALLLAASPIAAFAGDGTGKVDCIAHPTDPVCIVRVTTPGSPGSPGNTGTFTCHDGWGRAVPCFIPGKGWLGPGGCYFQRAQGTDLQLAELLGGKVSPPTFWYSGACGDPTTNFWPAGLTVLRAFDTDPGVQVLAQAAVQELQLPPPTIHLNPTPPAAQLVQVPMWMWLDSPLWTVRSATAAVPDLSVTATARPTSVAWSTGDGATVTCPGPGSAWKPGTNPAAGSPDCGHTYTTTSGQAGFTLRATITWSVTWAGGGATGTEPALTSTATVPITVAASAALNTGG
jgi:hypothetical protein